MRFRQPSAAELGVDDAFRREGAARVRQAWGGIERLARDCGCRFVVVPVPPRGELRGSWRTFQSAADATSLDAIDVVPALRAVLTADRRPVSSLHFATDAHLNAYGNRLFARAIADAIDWDAAREPAATAGPEPADSPGS